MGRNAKHTQDEVFEAADKIAASGQEVTPTVLRAALGGGSLTTIYRHLDAWQGQRKNAPAPVVFEMPEGVKAAFGNAWQAAATEAAKEIAAIREKADAEVKTIARRFEEALASIAQLESEAEADTSKLDALESQLAAERTAAIDAATEAAKREAALAATVSQMQNQINAQQAELARVHAEHDASRKEHAAENSRLTTDFTRQLAEQADALKTANAEVSRLRGKLDEETAKNERTMERERALIASSAEAQACVAKLTDQLKDQKQRSVEVITKLEQSKIKMEAELRSARSEALESATQLGTVSGQCEALRAQVQRQETLIKELAKPQEPPKQESTSKVMSKPK